jgi:hypothetical protein
MQKACQTGLALFFSRLVPGEGWKIVQVAQPPDAPGREGVEIFSKKQASRHFTKSDFLGQYVTDKMTLTNYINRGTIYAGL